LKITYVERINIRDNIFPLRVDDNLNYKIETLPIQLENIFISEDLIIEDKFKFDFLNCKICYSVVRDPVSCNQCEDLFCFFCMDFCLEKKNKCPHCRDFPFNERKINKNIKNILNEISIKCPLFCGEILKYKNLENHLEICTSRPKFYTCNSCCQTIKVENNDLKDLKTHYDECPNIMYKCPDCNNNFNKEQINKHISVCEQLFFDCEICTFRIPKKYTASHKDFYCKLMNGLNQKFEYFFEIV